MKRITIPLLALSLLAGCSQDGPVDPKPAPPTATAGGPYTADEGAVVHFDGRASADPQGSALTYRWTFGDGTEATGPTPTHRYAASGTHIVVLRVTNAAGLESRPDSTTATIANVAPTVTSFELSAATASVGDSVRAVGAFSDPGGGGNASWQWEVDWGDGTTQSGSAADTATRIEAAHAYATAGSYTVRLTVTDADGARAEATRTLGVLDAAAPLMHTLVDDFIGSEIDLVRWVFYEDSATVRQDDRLVVAPKPDQAMSYGGLLYRVPHRFVDTYVVAEVSQVTAGGPLTETVLGITALHEGAPSLDDDTGEYITFAALGGKIGAWAKRAGQKVVRLGQEIDYDPVAHRFWRLREADGVIHWQLSPDGTRWTQPAGWQTKQFFSDVNRLHALVAAGAFAADPNPGPAVFEGVNTLEDGQPSTLRAVPLRVPADVRVVGPLGITRRLGSVAAAGETGP